VFYLPMAAAVIWLNKAMPLEGGLYAWAHKAFGDLGGFLTAWNLWVYGIAVTATILYATPTEIAYMIGPSAAWLPENKWAAFGIVALIVLALTTAAVRGLELGKWIHNVGGAAMLAVFAGLILLPAWGLVSSRIHEGMVFAVVMPEMNLRMAALFGNMLFGALCGLEYVAIFAGESRNPARTIGQSVWIASPVICLMFILGTSSVAAFVPRGQIDFIAPIPQTMRAALGQTGVGNVMATAAILLVEMRLLSVYGDYAAAAGGGLGSAGTGLVYAVRREETDASEFDCVRGGAGAGDGGVGFGRCSCAGDESAAVECELDAL